MSECVLYSYWRSSSTWRVRLALHFKQIPFSTKTVNLLKNEQLGSDYVKLNPQGEMLFNVCALASYSCCLGFVPALFIDGALLTESMAIMEYLEETRPEHKILPATAHARAQARRLALMVVADIQPIQNLKGVWLVSLLMFCFLYASFMIHKTEQFSNIWALTGRYSHRCLLLVCSFCLFCFSASFLSPFPVSLFVFISFLCFAFSSFERWIGRSISSRRVL